MDTKILEDIGLTNAEIKIYLSLLELGSTTARPILEKSGLQNSVVHMTLNKLIDKGLVSFVKVGRINHYQSTNPKHIVDLINEKRERFEEILPELLMRQGKAKQQPEIITFRGIRGIKEMLLELLDAGGKEHNAYGSNKKSLMIADGWWEEYHKKRAKQGIKAKILFNKSLSPWRAEKKYLKSKIRYTKEGFDPLTETIIRNDKIGIIIWTDKPLGTIIHQKEAAESYDKFFEMMWKQAKN